MRPKGFPVPRNLGDLVEYRDSHRETWQRNCTAFFFQHPDGLNGDELELSLFTAVVTQLDGRPLEGRLAKQPDSERVWCDSHRDAVMSSAEVLQIDDVSIRFDPPLDSELFGFQTHETPLDLRSLVRRDYYHSIWMLAAPDDYVRACSAAFESR